MRLDANTTTGKEAVRSEAVALAMIIVRTPA